MYVVNLVEQINPQWAVAADLLKMWRLAESI